MQEELIARLNSLSEENIAKIADAYTRYVQIDGFSKAIEINYIVENDYNLNVTFYIMPREKTETIDLSKELSELKKIEANRQEFSDKVKKYVSEIVQAFGETQ